MDDGTCKFTLPSSLQGWLVVTEVAQGGSFAESLFTSKFGGPPPDFGRHIVVFYREPRGAYRPVSYLHYWNQERIGLIGGACTDGDVIRAMTSGEVESISVEGGLFRQTLAYALNHFDYGLDAFFSHSGNLRARSVMFDIGFQQTSDEHLLVKCVRNLQPVEHQKAIDQAMALGSF